jgi:hypothetical protein
MRGRLPILHRVKVTLSNGETGYEMFDITRHQDVLRDTLSGNPGIKAVFIDPIQTFLGAINMNSNSEVNQALTPLAVIAAESKVALVLVGHLNKKWDSPAMMRIVGSIGFVGTVRAIWGVAVDKDDDERILLTCIKLQNAKKPKSKAYRLIGQGEDEQPVLEFEDEPVDMDYEEVMSATAPDKKRDRLEECKVWLKETLKRWGGPMESKLIRERAKDKKFSNDTLYKAREALDVIEETIGHRRTLTKLWALRPEDFESQGFARMKRLVEEGSVVRLCSFCLPCATRPTSLDEGDNSGVGS